MTATAHTYKAFTANDQFKSQYMKVMRWSTLVAFFITVLVFLFSPKYVPNPYRIYSDELEVVDVEEEETFTPPEVQDIPKPQVAVEAAPDDEVDEDVEIADTLIDAGDLTAFDSLGEFAEDTGFVASQQKPILTKFVQPDYPEMARASQLEGTVVVKVLVGPDGNVMSAVVIQSVHRLLDRAAREAAMRCKFKPGKQRDIAVKAWMAIPFAFRLHS